MIGSTVATPVLVSPVALPTRVPRFQGSLVLVLARKEIRESLRNRWFLLYTAALAILALALSYLSSIGTGGVGFAGFGRTAASLIHLVILIVPLMALTTSASCVAGERERGTLDYLLAQPLSRTEVFFGKYLGVAVSLLASLCLAFGISALSIAGGAGSADAGSYARLVGLSFVLALTMHSVGFLISCLARRTTVAIGTGIFLWLGFVFLSDLGLMGSTIAFKLQVSELLHLSLINPLQVFKMAALGSLHASLDLLGPAGLYATRTYGPYLGVIFGAILTAWIVIPLLISWFVFVRRSSP